MSNALRFYGLTPNGSARSNLDIRLMKVPRGHVCSICTHPTTKLVVLTKGVQPIWGGICLWCIEQLSEAAGEP